MKKVQEQKKKICEQEKKCGWVVRIVAGRLNPQIRPGLLKIIQKGALATCRAR